MPRHHWIWFAGATGTLVVALGWQSAVARSPRPIDWAALNPAFAGATFVNDKEVCIACHQDAMHGYDVTRHARAFAATPPERGGECESCHGPRSGHVAAPAADLVLTRASAQSAVCLQCHDGGPRFGWKAGPHVSGDVSCISCHVVMEQKSDRALLAKAGAGELCFQCHSDVRADLNKMSHHPVREGRMDCASCHNVHGSTPALMTNATVNDTCVTCHAEKRGPFVWEHAPVRESCVTCHQPHGSNQRNMLTSKDPFLCLSCHSYGGHINLPRYNRTSNPYGSGCVNCHMTTHGSNHPSGAKFTR